MNVLVISHQRSGTHFLIDSILNNIENTVFPEIRPSYSSIQNLLLPHDQEVTDRFYEYTFPKEHNTELRIFKTHILPEEFEIALHENGLPEDSKERIILEQLYYNSRKVYILRDPYDTLVSRFHYEKSGGGIYNAMESRLKEMTPSEYIRSFNYHIMPGRAMKDYDRNVVAYLAYHQKVWLMHDVIAVNYENLKNSFEETIKKLAASLGLQEHLKTNIRKPVILKPSNVIGSHFVYKVQRKILKWANIRSTVVKPRKGVVGDHKNYFSKEDYEFIDREIQRINEMAYGPVRVEV
ncbi:MAG: sulfotransferase domain-containing protein [Candidatus Omnitrophota bacterium]